MAGRVRFEDLYADGDPTLETRYGVAIDRVTGSVAQGPLFEMEIATEAAFKGDIDVMNFTLGQLGVLSAALLDMNDGLVPVGFGKSKGFGRVKVAFNRFCVRMLKDMGQKLCGAGALRRENDGYKLPSNDEMEEMEWDRKRLNRHYREDFMKPHFERRTTGSGSCSNGFPAVWPMEVKECA